MNAPKLKVLVVDDDQIIRKGIIYVAEWDKHDMQVVADAPNGKRAWEAFMEHLPDIVITDIVMPEMNGIELAKKIKEHRPQAKILLLSSHRDFEYAQQGIELGASGYLLKTELNQAKITEYLVKFRNEIENQSLVQGESSPEISRNRHIQIQLWLGGVRTDIRSELLKWFASDWAWMTKPTYLYLLEFPTAMAEDQIHLMFKQALSAENELIPIGHDQCIFICNERNRNRFEQMLIEKKSMHEIEKWMKGDPISSPEEWIQSMKGLLKQSEIESKYGFESNLCPEPILKALQLMKDDINVKWTASEVSHLVGLSRSHFSVMFKKAVGENFMSYLHKRKLEVASELLLNTRLTLDEIAERTGMDCAKNFSKWFKRCMHDTPSQYRMRHRKNATV
ncbi:response regulator [Cohnella pontilimi]|uniref:Response regulator n=1 Tax=Cohnella pontilimi TaxID=2564100 RepID=A0A4U0FC49_9BACL|nr:response regulator [Cohnella pontilimi]TJY42426.1 response regulator [Cohnella pontilimi]